MSQKFDETDSFSTANEVHQLICNSHHCDRNLNDEEMDAAIGLNIAPVEATLDFIDLVLCYGQHRLYQGDIPYNVIRELYTRLDVFTRLHDYRISHILDLGSGYGRLVLYGALLWPDVHFCGIEMVVERVLAAQNVSRRLGLGAVEFISGDVLQIPWPFANCFLMMNSLALRVLPDVFARLETLAQQQEFIIVSVWSVNEYLRQQQWLEEVVIPDFLHEKFSLTIFKPIK